MTPGAATDGDTVAERRPAEIAPDADGRERLLRRGEEKAAMSGQHSQSPKESGDMSGKRSTSQRSQLPTRVRQLTSQLSTSGLVSAPSTLPRSGRERERLSQRRVVTSSTFLLQDAGRVNPPRRPASAADVDREVKKEHRDTSAPPTTAVSTPALAFRFNYHTQDREHDEKLYES